MLSLSKPCLDQVHQQHVNLPCSCTVPALNVTFKTGRVDCSNDTYNTTDVHTFPEPTMDRASMYEFFANEFDFSEDEVRICRP